jgi:MFS family permease
MNRYGRKASIYVGTLLIIGGALIQGFSVNKAMFIIGRVIVGHGSAWVGSAPTLITEIAYPTHRGKATSLYKYD